MRDRDQPSSLDEAPLEDRFPIRNVALFCDRCGDTEIRADIRADTAEEAYEALRRIAAHEHGWIITDHEDSCTKCANPGAGYCPKSVTSLGRISAAASEAWRKLTS